MRRLYPVFETLAKSDRSVHRRRRRAPARSSSPRAPSREQAPPTVRSSSRSQRHPGGANRDPPLFGPVCGRRRGRRRGGEQCSSSARRAAFFIDEIGDVPRHAQKKLRDMLTAGRHRRAGRAPSWLAQRDLDRDVHGGSLLTTRSSSSCRAATWSPAPPRSPGRRSPPRAKGVLEGALSQRRSPSTSCRASRTTRGQATRELRAVVQQRATFGELRRRTSPTARRAGPRHVTAVIQEGNVPRRPRPRRGSSSAATSRLSSRSTTKRRRRGIAPAASRTATSSSFAPASADRSRP